MTVYVDHRDFLTYAEGRELASRARAEAIRAIWADISAWFSRRITAAPAADRSDRRSGSAPMLEFHPWTRGELDQEFEHRGRLQAEARAVDEFGNPGGRRQALTLAAGLCR